MGQSFTLKPEKNGVWKQSRKLNNRKHRFNGKLRFAQYAGETEIERVKHRKTLFKIILNLYIVCVQ